MFTRAPGKKGKRKKLARKLLEKDIEKILAAEVRRLGGKAYKFMSPGNDGVPDRIVIFPNAMPVFAELKTDTGRLSKLQKIQIEKLASLGQCVEIIKGAKGLERFFLDYGYVDTAARIREKYLEEDGGDAV